MKLICSQENLLKGVITVSRAVPIRTTMSILECILIDASEDEIHLIANDTNLGIETVIDGQIEERGIVALDAKIFSDIVHRLPNDEVTIVSDISYHTVITCEKAKFSIMGKSGEDFSYLPYVEKEEPVLLSEFTLKEMIRQTIFSVSDSDRSEVMTGELMEIRENRMRLVSLDGHRISIRYTDLRDSYKDYRVVIPGKALSEISRIVPGDADSDVSLYLTQNHVLFEFGHTKVVSRLIEGKYFDVDRMISADYETKIRISKRTLADALDRASLLVKEGDKKPIVMNITDGNMEVTIQSFIGSMDENIPIEKEGRDLMIGFNPKFFTDALRVIDEEEVTLYMINPKSPCYIRDEKESYIYLILPINIGVSNRY